MFSYSVECINTEHYLSTSFVKMVCHHITCFLRV